MMYYLLLDGERIKGSYEGQTPPVDPAVEASTLTIPAAIAPYANDWVEILELGFQRYLKISGDPEQVYVVPVTGWQRETGTEYELNYINVSTVEGDFSVVDPAHIDSHLSYLNTNYSGLELPLTFTWDQANSHANYLLSGLTQTISDYQVTGTPLDDSITTVYSYLRDLETNFATPEEAIENMQDGLSGVAQDLGVSWPPPAVL